MEEYKTPSEGQTSQPVSLEASTRVKECVDVTLTGYLHAARCRGQEGDTLGSLCGGGLGGLLRPHPQEAGGRMDGPDHGDGRIPEQEFPGIEAPGSGVVVG